MKYGKRLDWIAFIIIFLAALFFQLQYISLPHFWDEAWVYAPAIRAMGQNIPSLMPDAISVDLGRGHPLLFQFIGGLWTKIFGDSNASLHSYALSISLILIFSIYYFLKQIVDWRFALLGVILLLVQPSFLVQMSMVYPEILMTLGVVAALFFFTQKRNLHFSIALSIALYSKESAVVFFIAFLFWDLLRYLILRDNTKDFNKYIVPFLVLLSHPIFLYMEFGWFLYPEHVGFIEWDIQSIKYNLRKVFRVLFERQNRGFIIYPVLIIAVLIKRFRHWSINILLLLIGFSAYKVLEWKWVVPNALFVIIMVIAAASPIAMWLFASKTKPKFNELETLVGIGYISIVGFLIFSAMNFFTPRYLIVILVLLIILILIIASSMRLPFWSGIAILIFSILVSSSFLVQTRTSGESNLGLYDDLQVQKKLVNWIFENVSPEKLIATNFVTATYLTNPDAGYLSLPFIPVKPIISLCDSSAKADILVVTQTDGECRDFSIQNALNTGYEKIYADTIRSSAVLILEKKTESF